MTANNSTASKRILDSLPLEIQAVIVAYAGEAKISPQSVIEYILERFLMLDTSLTGDEQASSDYATSFLSELPTSLQNQVKQYASATDMPPEFVIELAIAHFLDPDSVTFDDCKIKIQPVSIEWLKQRASHPSATAA